MTDRPYAESFNAEGWQPPNGGPDFTRCGAGHEEFCCALMLMGPGGLECGRYTSLMPTLANRVARGEMSARFVPEQDDCQAERAAVEAKAKDLDP